jgi:hypothetical protein
MKTLSTAIAMIMLFSGAACAEKKNFEPKDRFCVIEHTPTAKGPIGAVVEAAGVFAGKIASATEIAVTGERKITVENETGECRIFPFCATTKIADNTFDTATFGKLKKGERVKVEYKEENGVVKADKVIIEGEAGK